MMRKHLRKTLSLLTALTLFTGILSPAITQAEEPYAETEFTSTLQQETYSEPVTESITETDSELTSERLTEPVSESVSEPITEADSEATSEKLTEPVSESVSEKTTEGSSEQDTELFSEGSTESTAQEFPESETDTLDLITTLSDDETGDPSYDLTTGKGLTDYINTIPSVSELNKEYIYKYSDTAKYQAYQIIRQEAIRKATTAYNAYKALGSGESIDTDIYNKMYNVWQLGQYKSFTGGVNFTPSSTADPNYVYQFSSSCYYQGSMHQTNGSTVCTFLLVDTSKYPNWSPNTSTYQSGTSNYEVAFCCDNGISAWSRHPYKRVNLEDSTYYSSEAASHIRAIVQASYPFISEEAMVSNLKANGVISDCTSLDTSQLLSAAQGAIWHYANGKDITCGQIFNPNPDWYSNELVADLDYNYNQSEVKNNILAIYNYLIGLAPASSGSSMVISDVSYEAYKTENGDKFNVAVKVMLNTEVKSGDKLQITASAAGKDISASKTISSGKEFILTLYGVEANDQIEVTVSGTQYLEKNVYFYEPWADPDSPDYTADRRASSQSLVGVSSGATAVYAAKSFHVDKAERSAAVTLYKTNKAKTTPLSGAEFELNYVNTDGSTLAVLNGESKTFTTDANGKIVFDNLLLGDYILTETKSPAGYTFKDTDREIRFKLSADDKNIKITLTNDSADTSVDGTMLTVSNDAAKGKASIKVIKQINYIDPAVKELAELFAQDAVFYIGIFEDAAGTRLYGDDPVRTIHIKGESSGSVTFSNLDAGTYYIFETDASGKAIPAEQIQTTSQGKWICQLIEGSQQKVSFTSADSAPQETIILSNSYYYVPEGFYLDEEETEFETETETETEIETETETETELITEKQSEAQKAQSERSVSTGDDSPIFLYAAIAAAALLILLLCGFGLIHRKHHS